MNQQPDGARAEAGNRLRLVVWKCLDTKLDFLHNNAATAAVAFFKCK